MSVSAITSFGTPVIGSTYQFPTKKLYQPTKSAQSTSSKPYQVTLTSEAKAKSLELQGYTVDMISAKLGLSTSVVDQYLGIAGTTSKSTYTPPKSTYTPSKSTGASA